MSERPFTIRQKFMFSSDKFNLKIAREAYFSNEPSRNSEENPEKKTKKGCYCTFLIEHNWELAQSSFGLAYDGKIFHRDDVLGHVHWV